MRMRVLGLLCLAIPAASAAQGVTGRPNPYLFVLDLQGTALDEFPGAVKALNGTMTVVDRNGRRMLRASSPSEFLITLPQALPADFTVEVELIPKACCNPEDFMLEGTPSRNRGVASAELTWQPAHIMAVGGGGAMYQSDMPADLAASTPGNLTQLVWEFKGTTVKLYTNGRRLYTLDKQFVRGRVLRVWLGGQDERAHAVYLAGLRIGAGPAAPGVIAGSAGLPGGSGATANPPAASPPPGAPSPAAPSASQLLPGAGGSRVIPNVAVAQGAGGPLVTWGLLRGATSYAVKRWKSNDLTCCNATSPTLSGPPWQDGALPVAGTYVFEVTATSPGWTATGQAQFVQFATPGQIATVAPSGSIAPTSPAVASGVTSVSSSSAAPPNSAINQFLPPPSRSIVLNGILGTGGSPMLPARTIVLAAAASSGIFPQVPPRTLTFSAISGTGPVIVLNRTVAGMSAPAIPVPRSIVLAAVSAVGVSAVPLPRTVSLTRLAAAGSFPRIAPRVVNLAGWAAAGLKL